MAEVTRESSLGDPTTAAPNRTPEPPTRHPKGVVLGKDGKPCRSCTSFADMTAQSKKFARGKASAANTADLQAAKGPPPDCPPDVEQLGRASWSLLHSITATYPETPTPNEQNDVKQFMRLFGKLYPCWVCAEDFQSYMARNKVKAETRDQFGRWMCEAHNEVNRKLGKNEFDCNKWEERWRTGWKNGSCD